MLNTYILELALVPYIIFIDFTLVSVDFGFYYYASLSIDILHVLNMAFIFVTAIPSDQGWIEIPGKIALDYVT